MFKLIELTNLYPGSGRVIKIGSGVTKAAVGDKVFMSFMHCGDCRACNAVPPLPSNCARFVEMNVGRNKNHFTNTISGDFVKGSYFGQSSMANFTIADETSILNASNLVKDDEELKLLAPLSCGMQTGVATVLNCTDAGPNSELMIFGLGGVGLSAVMAAKIQNCKIIIAVDRVASRLKLAKELGATHIIDTSEGLDHLAENVNNITSTGVRCIIDTTGVAPLLDQALRCLAIGGTLLLIASVPESVKMIITPLHITSAAHTIRGILMGNSIPSVIIPKMVEWYHAGKFPIERLTKFFKADDFQQALTEMHTGETVKPILVW